MFTCWADKKEPAETDPKQREGKPGIRGVLEAE